MIAGLLALSLAWGSPADAELTGLVDAEKWITLRTRAAEVLDEYPNDVVAHYAMGMALWQGDADLARAWYHLSRSRELYEADRTGEWLVHANTLEALADVANQQDRRQVALDLMDAYDAEYNPKRVGERGWPLMKLGRIDDIRYLLARAREDDAQWDVGMLLNSLCAYEAEHGHREAALRACEDDLNHTRAQGWSVDIAASNAARTARANLDFDQAEAWAREGFDAGTDTAPGFVMLQLLLASGRTADAAQAVQRVQSIYLAQDPVYRVQERGDMDRALATLLLVAGHGERALARADRAVLYPDRLGFTSSDPEEVMAWSLAVRRAARQVQREREAEQAAARGWAGRLWFRLGRLLPDAEDVSDRARLAQLLTKRELLIGAVRIYDDRGCTDLQQWMLGDLVDVVGPGVLASAVRHARREESLAGIGAYHDALEAEVALAQGRYGAAWDRAERAAGRLPEEEVLLRARVAAVAGRAAWKRRHRDEALARYGTALQLDPGTLRRMGVALPATVEHDGTAEGRKLAGMIRRSPRIDKARGAFRVSIRHTRGELVACLISPHGDQLSCSHTAPPQGEDGEALTGRDWAVAAADDFHLAVFAPPMGLSLHDLNSLDSMTGASQEAAREQVEGWLEQL